MVCNGVGRRKGVRFVEKLIELDEEGGGGWGCVLVCGGL